jgi:radical SAM protein with 4Fe4S-binding SPASM domain
MSLLSKNHFCILPWVHLHISQSGKVHPCCNNNRHLGNVQEQTIKEIWNGEQFKQLRSQFEADTPDKRCSHCYNIEKSGKESLRQISNKKYQKDIIRVEDNNPKPIYLDIRFSNICNFKCKTCWHGNSSAWYEEGSKKNASESRVIKAFTNDFNEILEFIDDVEEIYFAGGEPLIMEEHYQLLEELEKRRLYHILLRYNTNFSTLNFKDKNILEIWKKFNNVHVSASIDGSFSLGEEIREGFKWNQFIENRKLMLAVCPNIYFEITPTVSTLNIENISELHQYLVTNNLLDINNIYLNFLERPLSYNLKSLPTDDKKEAKEIIQNHINWLTNNNANKLIVKEFKDTLNYF